MPLHTMRPTRRLKPMSTPSKHDLSASHVSILGASSPIPLHFWIDGLAWVPRGICCVTPPSRASLLTVGHRGWGNNAFESGGRSILFPPARPVPSASPPSSPLHPSPLLSLRPLPRPCVPPA
eukprot:5770481-Pyramimonas_sp.AAC.1